MNHHLVRQQLLSKRDELLSRTTRIQRDLQHADQPLSQDFADQATEMENTEVLHGIDAESRHTLLLINRALQRLDNGNYETCSKCGGEIGAQRLSTLPFAEHCINCAN